MTQGQRADQAGAHGAGGTGRDDLARDFESLGLSPYEARLLLALLRLGSGDTTQLSRLAHVPRTSAYQVLDELTSKGLAVRVPAAGPTAWVSPGRDEVLDRLSASQEERLRQYRERVEQARETLARAWPVEADPALPFLQLIPSAAGTKRAFEEMVARTAAEMVAFSRPPYSWPVGRVSRLVVEAARRGVRIRALYEASSLEPAADGPFRAEVEAYVAAGVEARVIDELPMKLVVFDRATVLMALTEPGQRDDGYPTNVLVEHPGFAGVQVDAFEQWWARGRPWEPGLSPPGVSTALADGGELTSDSAPGTANKSTASS